MKDSSLLHLLFLLSLVSPIFSLFKSSYPIPNTGYSTDDDTVINVFPDPVNTRGYGTPRPHWPERTERLPSIGRLPIPFPSDEGSVGGSLGYGASIPPWDAEGAGDYYANGIRGAIAPNAVGLDDYFGPPYIPEGVDSIPPFGPEIFDRYYGDAGRYVFGGNVPGYGSVGGLGYGASSLPWIPEGTHGGELYPIDPVVPEEGYELPMPVPASDNDPILIQVFPDTVPSRGYGVPPLPQGTEGSDGEGSFGGYGNGGYGTGPVEGGEEGGATLPGDNEEPAPVPSPIGWPFVFPREEEGEGSLGGYGNGGYGTGPLEGDGDNGSGPTVPGGNEVPSHAPSPIGWPFVYPSAPKRLPVDPQTNVEDIDPVNPIGIDEKEGDNEDGSGFPELCDPHGNWDCILYRR